MKAILQERIPEVTLTRNSTEQGAKRVEHQVRIRAAFYVLLAASIGFTAAGAYTAVRGWDARNQVRDQLVAEQITTPDDASIPNRLVDDAATAQAQADIIKKHALEATGGKTYAQMDREDPARATALAASGLRTSLLAAVLAFNVANLAIGFGAFVAGSGLLLALMLILLRPKFRTA